MPPETRDPLIRRLSTPDVARATGASQRQVYRWRAGTSEPQRRFAERLDDLSTVLVVLGDSLTETGCLQWLKARNRLLDAKRPIDMLAADEFELVHAAALALAEGVYV